MKKVAKAFSNWIRETNKTLLVICLALSALGVLMVHTATVNQLTEGDAFSRDVRTMIIAVCVGVVLAIAASFIDYNVISKLWILIALVCLALMVALFVPGWGRAPSARSDAKSWLLIGSFYFQPSELLKIGFIITFTVHLDAVREKLNKIKTLILVVIHAGIAIGLVVVTGDLGSALVFICIFIGMVFIAGVPFKFMALGFAFVGLAVPVAWMGFLSDFQKQRFLAIYYPSGLAESTYKDVIYQQNQGLNAIGSGQMFGTGLFNGVYTQNGIVPENQNDMIFSVIGEQFGFVGCILTLLAISLVIILIIRVGKKSNDFQGKLMSYGVAIMIGAQTIINIGMCLKVLPVIGITLPFLSAGGSSSLCIYIAIGLVLSIHRFNQSREPVDFRYSQISTPFSETFR